MYVDCMGNALKGKRNDDGELLCLARLLTVERFEGGILTSV